MSPSSTSSDFPRLTGADNFDVWKTRTRAYLDGKNLLRFIDDPNYELDAVSDDVDDDEDMDSASDGHSDSDLDSDGSSEPDSQDDDAGDQAEDHDDDGSTVGAADVRRLTLHDSPAQDQVDGDANVPAAQGEPSLPASARVESFEAKNAKRVAKARKKAAKAKARKKAKAKAKARAKAMIVVAQTRRLNAQVKSFLMKTLDDKHIRIVKGFDKAFDIYQAICDRYKGTKAYGDPYGIMNYLYNARYQEGEDITEFILKYEDAMSGLNTVMNNSFNDEVFSLLLFNAMPASWESEMRIWRGNREILPLRELKSNLESHVTKKLAQERFALAKGTPESKETQNERALVSTAPVASAQALIGTSSNAGRSCLYCTRSNHTMATCRVLVRHILNGEVKPNTVLPANFKMPSTTTPRTTSNDHGNRQHPYSRGQNRIGNGSRRNNGQREYGQGNRNPGRGNSHGNSGNYNNSNGYPGNGGNGSNGGFNNGNFNNGNFNNNNYNGNNGNNGNHHQANIGYHQSRHDTAMIAISAATAATFGLTATAIDSDVDPVWTIDSGCTRHVTYNDAWFTTTTPYTGWITVGGQNQIPILAIGDVSLRVVDSKGQPKTLTLRNVLYAPDLKFNLFSVPAAVKEDFRFSFNRAQCAITTNQHFSVKAKIATHADLYQFSAKPASISTEDATTLVALYGLV